MNIQNKFEYVASQIKEVENFIKENSNCIEYRNMVNPVVDKLAPIIVFAKENNVPLKIDIHELIDNYYDSENSDSDSYEDKDESSYY